jgi:CRISPR-associated protein Cas5h
VLGLIAAILGLEKDALAAELTDAEVALAGRCPKTHWHGCNLRKTKSAKLLPPVFTAERPAALELSEESNTRLRQEWLLDPDFEVIASMPAKYQRTLEDRLREGTTHFTPCMGLSEMIASVEGLGGELLTRLPPGVHRARSVVRVGTDTRIAVETVLHEQLRVLSISLPRSVSSLREFTHASYFIQPEGHELPVETSEAWQSSLGPVMFL